MSNKYDEIFQEVFLKTRDTSFTSDDLYDLKNLVESKITQKQNEDKVKLLEVNVDGLTYGIFEPENYQRALEVFNKYFNEYIEQNGGRYSFRSGIMTINVNKSDVSEKLYDHEADGFGSKISN